MPIDVVYPLKIEDGQDFDSTETDPTEDYITAKGFVIEDDTDVRIEKDVSGNLVFMDVVSGGPYTLADLIAGSGGLTEGSHRTLDQLVHTIAETAYYEITYDTSPAWRILSEIWWENNTKAKKVREIDYTYDTIVWKYNVITHKQYDGAGSLVETLTETYSYSGPYVSNIESVYS